MNCSFMRVCQVTNYYEEVKSGLANGASMDCVPPPSWQLAEVAPANAHLALYNLPRRQTT
jgi:hypothetical protein